MASAVGAVRRAHKTLTSDQKLELLDLIGKKSYTVLCENIGTCKHVVLAIYSTNYHTFSNPNKFTNLISF